MFLFAQIQLHDHSSVFGVAEVLFAIAAELSVCLCHITAQRLLKLLRDAAPRDHIAHAGVPYSVLASVDRSLNFMSRNKILGTRKYENISPDCP